VYLCSCFCDSRKSFLGSFRPLASGALHSKSPISSSRLRIARRRILTERLKQPVSTFKPSFRHQHLWIYFVRDVCTALPLSLVFKPPKCLSHCALIYATYLSIVLRLRRVCWGQLGRIMSMIDSGLRAGRFYQGLGGCRC
jgi:hypothetical protein